MKALNRKSSSTSLQIMPNETSSPATSRGSVPPDTQTTTSSSGSKGPRAKSVSKEPAPRDDSQNGSLSRFFSLSRRIAKIRFSSSSQPPAPMKSPLPATGGGDSSELTPPPLVKTQSSAQLLAVPNSKSDLEESSISSGDKKNLRDRALSPSRLLGRLRPRSPFGRSNRNSASAVAAAASAQAAQPSESQTTPSSTTTTTIASPSTKNKSFTVNSNTNSPVIVGQHSPRSHVLMSASFHSESIPNSNSYMDEAGLTGMSAHNRLTRATTAGPSSLSERAAGGLHLDSPSSNSNAMTGGDKMRSLSCEFIDSNVAKSNAKMGGNYAFRELNETLDENDESSYADNNSIITASSYSNVPSSEPLPRQQQQPLIKPGKKVFTLSSGTGSKVEALRKNFMDATTSLGN